MQQVASLAMPARPQDGSLFASDRLFKSSPGQGTGESSKPLKRQGKGKSCMGCYQAKQRCRGYPCSRCSEKGIQCVPQSTAAIASYKRQKDNELVVRKHSSSSGEKEKKPVPSTSNYGGWRPDPNIKFSEPILPPPEAFGDLGPYPPSIPQNQDASISVSIFGSQPIERFPLPPPPPLGFQFGNIHTTSSPSTGSSHLEDKPVVFGPMGAYGDMNGHNNGFAVPVSIQGSTMGLPSTTTHIPRIDNVEMKPVSKVHSAALERDAADTLVPIINDYEPFCNTLARHRAQARSGTDSDRSSASMGMGQYMYNLPYDSNNPRPDLHSLVFNVKFREEMKATFLAKSPQFMLRRMSAGIFDAITRTEAGAWSAAVAMIAYPWNPLWAKLHTSQERQQLFKLLEREALSHYHSIKTRPKTWLEALAAGSLIVTALFEIGKYTKAWFLASELYLHAVQFGLHRKGAGSVPKGAIGKAIFIGPRDSRTGPLRPEDGFLSLGDDIWWNLVRLTVSATVGLDNTDNPVNLEKIWTPWPTAIGTLLPPPCKFYDSARMAVPLNLPKEDYESQTTRLKVQLVIVFSEVVSLTHTPSTQSPPSSPLPNVPLTQQGDPEKHFKLQECHATIQAEVKSAFDPLVRSGSRDPMLYDLWLVLGISEIYLFLAEDSDYRNDRIVNACLSVAGMLSSLCSSHNALLSELDALTISTLHAVRTACRQETMRYDRVGVPKDALYDLLVIEASHVDQIMSQLATTSPMAANTFAWYQSSGISHFASDAASYQPEWNANDGAVLEEVAPEVPMGPESKMYF